MVIDAYRASGKKRMRVQTHGVSDWPRGALLQVQEPEYRQQGPE